MSETLFHLLVPQIISSVPNEVWPATIGPELRGDPDLQRIPNFPEVFAGRIIEEMTAYVDRIQNPDDIEAALDRHDILTMAASLIRPPRTGDDANARDALTQTLSNIVFDENNPPSPDDRNFRTYVGLLAELDRVLRQSGGQAQSDLRHQMQDMPPELIEAAGLSHLTEGPEGAGRMNFQDPVKGAEDLKEAIDSMRRKARTHPVVAVPESYYQAESNYPSGVLELPQSIFIPGTRIIKPDMLARPTQIIMQKPGVFRSTPIFDREMTNMPGNLRRTVGKLQLVDYVLYLINNGASSQAFSRMLSGFMKEEGLEAGTFIKALPGAYQKAIQYYEVAANMSSDKGLHDLTGSALNAVEIGALSTLAKTPLVFDISGSSQVITTETGPGIFMDAYYGDTGDWLRGPNGRYLFTTPGNSTSREYSQLTPNERKRAIPSFYPEDDPLRRGRTIHAQQWYTSTPIMREETGGDPYFALLKARLTRQLPPGFSWESIMGPRGVYFDNGKPLTINSSKVRNRIAEANGNVGAGVDYMLAQILFVNHVAEIPAGMGLATQLNRSRRGDLFLYADFVSEGEIATAMRAAHARKYQNVPVPTLRLLQQHHKEIEMWKATSVDPLMIALDGKEGYHAIWRNPLNPELSPEIAPIQFRNEVNADGTPVTIAQKIKSLEKSGQDPALLNKLKRGTNYIRGIHYARNEWGFDSTMRDLANAIVDTGEKARGASDVSQRQRWLGIQKALVHKTLRTYFDKFAVDDLAPSGYRRSQQEIYPILTALAEMGKDSTSGIDPVDDLEDFNFTNTLTSFGWEAEPETEAAWGLQGLFRTTRFRNAATSMAYHIDKIQGKYVDKYPGMSAEYGPLLLNAIPVINNAIESTIMSWGIQRQDRLAGFSADSFNEFIIKSAVNFFLSGVRTQEDRSNYLKELIETFAQKIPSGAKYLSYQEQSNQYANILRQLKAVAGATIHTNLLLANKLINKDGLEVASLAQPAVSLEFDEADEHTTIALREAGFGTNYPDEATNKHPYVSLGIEGLDKTKTEVTRAGALLDNKREVEMFGAWSHMGAETLMLTIILMFAQDGLSLNKYKAAYIRATLGIEEAQFEKLTDLIQKEVEAQLSTPTGTPPPSTTPVDPTPPAGTPPITS